MPRVAKISDDAPFQRYDEAPLVAEIFLQLVPEDAEQRERDDAKHENRGDIDGAGGARVGHAHRQGDVRHQVLQRHPGKDAAGAEHQRVQEREQHDPDGRVAVNFRHPLKFRGFCHKICFLSFVLRLFRLPFLPHQAQLL